MPAPCVTEAQALETRIGEWARYCEGIMAEYTALLLLKPELHSNSARKEQAPSGQEELQQAADQTKEKIMPGALEALRVRRFGLLARVPTAASKCSSLRVLVLLTP